MTCASVHTADTYHYYYGIRRHEIYHCPVDQTHVMEDAGHHLRTARFLNIELYIRKSCVHLRGLDRILALDAYTTYNVSNSRGTHSCGRYSLTTNNGTYV